METLFNLKQVVLHQRNNSDEEVSGEINYLQPDNTTCVTSYILAVCILVLLTVLPFFLLHRLSGNGSKIIWLYENGMNRSHFCSGTKLLSFDESRKREVLNPLSLCSVINILF